MKVDLGLEYMCIYGMVIVGIKVDILFELVLTAKNFINDFSNTSIVS